MARIFVIEDEKIANAIEILLEKKKQIDAKRKSITSFNDEFIERYDNHHTYHSGCGSGGCGNFRPHNRGCGGRIKYSYGGCGGITHSCGGCGRTTYMSGC